MEEDRPKQAYDVFICYSSKDKIIADTIVAAFERANIRCWYAPRDIFPGVDWGKAITHGIRNSSALVLIFSSHADHSQRVLDEVNFAISEEKPILPFRIENLEPSGALRLHLSSRHWMNAYSPSWQSHIDRLVRIVTSILKGESMPEEAPARLQPQPVARKRRLPVPIRLFMGILLGLAVLLPFSIWAYRIATRSLPETITGTVPQSSFSASQAVTEKATLAPAKPILFPPTETPLPFPSIQLIQRLDAPGDDPNGLAWDGESLWVCSMNRVMKLDHVGQTIEFFSLPLDGVLWNCGGTFTGISGNLWVPADYPGWSTLELVELSPEGGKLEAISAIPLSVSVNSGTKSLTWDGQNFWVAQDSFIYKIDPTGAIVDHFVFPSTTPIIGMVWDGSFFLVSTGVIHADQSISFMDPSGRIIASSSLPGGSGSLAWDGAALWALTSSWPDPGGNIFQYDISEAERVVLEECQARLQTRALDGKLSHDNYEEGNSTSGEGVVKVINDTGERLTVSFEKSNYSIQVEPGDSRMFVPPDNFFTATIPGLPPIQGNYPYELQWYSYTWVFSIREATVSPATKTQ